MHSAFTLSVTYYNTANLSMAFEIFCPLIGCQKKKPSKFVTLRAKPWRIYWIYCADHKFHRVVYKPWTYLNFNGIPSGCNRLLDKIVSRWRDNWTLPRPIFESQGCFKGGVRLTLRKTGGLVYVHKKKKIQVNIWNCVYQLLTVNSFCILFT